MQEINDFERGAVTQFTDVVRACVSNKGKRTINICSMTIADDDGKPTAMMVTMVCEPAVFSETIYPIDAPFTTSVIHQLKKFEEVA